MPREPKEYTRTDLRFAQYGGLFDGEGCISMWRSKGLHRYRVTLRAVMVRRETLERMNSHFGVGTLKQYGPRPGRQPYWVWFCSKPDEVIRILKSLRPYLDVKAHEANLALDYLLHDDLTPAQQDRIYEAMRRAKIRKNGYPQQPIDGHRRKWKSS